MIVSSLRQYGRHLMNPFYKSVNYSNSLRYQNNFFRGFSTTTISIDSTIGFNWDRDYVLLKTETEINDVMKLGTVIGHGSYGTCRKSLYFANDKDYCVKIIRKEVQTEFKREIQLASRINHPSICSPLKVFESSSSVYILSELYNGGELFDYLVDNNMFLGTLTEHNALCIIREMLVALEQCHKAGFAHLDVKPENFVFRVPPKELETDFRQRLPGNLVLIDFGAAQPFRLKMYASRSNEYDKNMDDYISSETTTLLGGTASYVSPEVLHGRFSSRSDLWSLGVTLFMMIAGRRPFDTHMDCHPSVFEREVQTKIKQEAALPLGESLYSTCEELGLAGSSTVSLLLNMMHPEPNLRKSATELIEEVDIILENEIL